MKNILIRIIIPLVTFYLLITPALGFDLSDYDSGFVPPISVSNIIPQSGFAQAGAGGWSGEEYMRGTEYFAGNENDYSGGFSDPRRDGRLNHRKPGFREFVADTGIFYSTLWAARFIYVRNKNDRIFDTSFPKWWDNITTKPEFDDGDDFVTNFVNHPAAGAIAYLAYRARGNNILYSALGSALISTLWEYTIEGLVETPSAPDLISTPGVGVPIGMGMDFASRWLMSRDTKMSRIAAYLFNPLRIFTRGRRLGLLNPLTGVYAFQGPFEITDRKSKAMNFPTAFFTESPVPVGRMRFNIETINLDNDQGGQLILYSVRIDFASRNQSYGLYLKLPFGGVNNVIFGDRRLNNGFELGNIQIGNKLLVYDSDDFVLSGGIELTFPTAYKDNLDRLKAVIQYRRDLPLYLKKAFTVGPYISAAARRGWLGVQGSIGMDFLNRAEGLEGDFFEARLKYGTAVSAQFDGWVAPKLIAEFNGFTMHTAEDSKKTDLFITPAVRFGKRFSPGFGVQIPLRGPSADFARADFIVEFQAWF